MIDKSEKGGKKIKSDMHESDEESKEELINEIPEHEQYNDISERQSGAPSVVD